MNDVALGSPSRVPCRTCGMQRGYACTINASGWRYCPTRIEDLKDLLTYEEAAAERPRKRGDCANADRPCPWVACRHHLYLDINPHTGTIKINAADLEPWELEHTCSLDIADAGGMTLEETGMAFRLTRERVRQIETKGLVQALSYMKALGVEAADSYFTHPLGNESTNTPDAEPTAARISHRERQARYEERKRARRGNGG